MITSRRVSNSRVTTTITATTMTTSKMPHRETAAAATVVWCLLSSAALVQMNLAGNVLAATGQQQQQNASSIEQSSSHLLFPHHPHPHHPQHHHHLDGHSTSAGATCGTSHRHHHHQGQLDATDQQSAPASLSSSLLRTYIRTNNMRAYHLDLHTYRPEAKFAGDPSYVDSRDEQHQQTCRHHLNHYHRLLKAYYETDPMEMSNSMESLRLVDTFGRPEPGLLDGNQFWLGSYERCQDFKSLMPSIGDDKSTAAVETGELSGGKVHIQSQYCLGLSQFPSWNPKDTKTSIKIGMCLPESCTSSMLNEQKDLFDLAESMMKSQLGVGLPFSKLRLRSIYCLPHETSQIRQYSWSGKMLISILSLFVVACIYATISDYLATRDSPNTVKALMTTPTTFIATTTTVNGQKEPVSMVTQSNVELTSSASSTSATTEKSTTSEPELKLVAANERTWRNILVESFSIIQSFKKLTNIRPIRIEAAKEQMFNSDLFFGSITGIKCIGLLWIIAAHTFLVGPIPMSNLIHLDKITKTYLANLYLSAHLMVDSFFVLSGVLASYMIFKSGLEQIKMRHWITMTVHRYWRLTPIYLLCYWFAKSLGHLNNSGPIWDYMTAEQSPRLNCANESWLYAILQMSDFKSPKNHCVPFAWFIANGIKFWIVTPIFVLAIYKSVRRGYALLAAAIAANCLLVFVLVFNSSVDMKSVIEFRPESADNMLNDMEDIYTRPYSRIGAYLVGLLAGHWFYTLEREQKRLQLSDKTKYLIWSLVSMTMFLFVFVVKLAGGMKLDDAAIPWVFSTISAVIRPTWALCTCWLVFALAHGQAKWLASFLCAPSWALLAKVSFSAYLVQGEVIANLLLAVNHSTPFVYSELVSKPLYCIAATIAVAVLITIFVEYPLHGIEELLLPPKRPRNTTSKTKTVDSENSSHQSNKTVLQQADQQQQVTCDHDNRRGNKLKEL